MSTGAQGESFGDTSEMADTLLALVISGRKRATAWAAVHGTRGAEVGRRWAVVDGTGRSRAVVETTELFRCHFADVDKIFARDEGKGDCSIEYRRNEHKRFFLNEGTFSEDMEVYCERFKLVTVL